MRHFTKTHNDLKWLFPIAKTKKQATEVFNYVEENAKTLADSAGITDKEQRDLAIDAFMKGYSYALQLEIGRCIEKKIKDIYCALFNVKCDLEHEEEWKKYFRFTRFYDMLKEAAWEPRNMKKAMKHFRTMMEGSAFDWDAPVKEQLKIMR